MSTQDGSQLVTKRTEHIVGRKAELERLRKCLHTRGERHFIYYYGEGGIGKTRMLEELQMLVTEAGPGFYSTNIIDLFHTDTHSTSDMEQAIIEGLDPDEKYFKQYRDERKFYELLRERGTDPGVLEHHRTQLSQYFVDGCLELALDARKIVICFDTVELLQYESSEVEEIAGLDTIDTRIKPWLLHNLAKLKNVLVVFAGRPKKPAPQEYTDPQQRLIKDMKEAFGNDFVNVPLPALTLQETTDLIHVLGEGERLIPDDLLSIVHLLTGGRPVFLHLVIDLILILADEPGKILELFRKYRHLVDAPENNPEISKAREEVEIEILKGIFNETTKFGWYLDRLAALPKGVDSEILVESMGLPEKEARQLLEELASLSFVKTYKTIESARQLQPGRVFLHDELYRVLKSDVIPNWRYMERQVAYALVKNYYTPHIEALEEKIQVETDPQQRIPLRVRLQKLQAERLYYLLVHDAEEGYTAYKQLSEEANWRRWVGFSMRLLDEFLLYYNDPDRRKQFEKAKLTHNIIVKESTMLWSERFYWWGQSNRLIPFAEHILGGGSGLVDPDDIEILANICARWADAQAMHSGHSMPVVEKAQAILNQLPSFDKSNPVQILSRARLSAGLGYQYQQGGMFKEAVHFYEEAKTGFIELPAYKVELAIWLHALAFVYAKQGKMLLAIPLAREALRINEELQYEYSTGLTLSALSGIERMRGLYDKAIDHGTEALVIFQRLEDPHGTALAYNAIVRAQRRKAKELLGNGRKLEEAQTIIEKICLPLVDKGIAVAQANQLDSLKDLGAERGRLYRELAHIIKARQGMDQAMPYYRQAESELRKVTEIVNLTDVERAGVLEDLAEVLYFSKDEQGAIEKLEQVINLIGDDYLIEPGKRIPAPDLPVERFSPLGLVELLRGQMYFTKAEPKREDLESGLQHYLTAYAYFLHFSEDALEKDTMVEYLYNHLHQVPARERREILESVKSWAQQVDLGANVNSFLDVLSTLLG